MHGNGIYFKSHEVVMQKRKMRRRKWKNINLYEKWKKRSEDFTRVKRKRKEKMHKQEVNRFCMAPGDVSIAPVMRR